MSEKNLPLDPSVLEPTLFDMSLSEDEQAALDAEVKKDGGAERQDHRGQVSQA